MLYSICYCESHGALFVCYCSWHGVLSSIFFTSGRKEYHVIEKKKYSMNGQATIFLNVNSK